MAIVGKKIAFLTCGYPLDVSAMLINSLELLKADNEVEIIVSPFDTRHERCPDWMHALFIHAPTGWTFFYRMLRRLCREIVTHLGKRHSIAAWWIQNADLFRFRTWLTRRVMEKGYDIVIAVECHALIAAAPCASERTKILYYNMELLDWAEENPLYVNKLPLKKLEYAALEKVSHVMIPSADRARVFAEINSFPPERISVLPVVPRKNTFAHGSRYFRDLFSIPENKRIVVYSGNFMPWAQCLEIIESMDDWPENAVLVMHTWNEDALSSAYFFRMRQAAQGRPVYFSSRYLAYEDLPAALSSADVGLLFYEAIDANFMDIMFSSNKFGEYMAAGIPVVCSPFPALREFVDEHAVGKSVALHDTGSALQEILSSERRYKEHVVLCREKFFDFDAYFITAYTSLVFSHSP